MIAVTRQRSHRNQLKPSFRLTRVFQPSETVAVSELFRMNANRWVLKPFSG